MRGRSGRDDLISCRQTAVSQTRDSRIRQTVVAWWQSACPPACLTGDWSSASRPHQSNHPVISPAMRRAAGAGAAVSRGGSPALGITQRMRRGKQGAGLRRRA